MTVFYFNGKIYDSFEFNGKMYDSFEEFIAASKNFESSNITDESLDYLFDNAKKTLMLNTNIYRLDISNEEMSTLLTNLLLTALADRIKEKNRVDDIS